MRASGRREKGSLSGPLTLAAARKALRALADPHRARFQRVFFKHSNDVFLGATTPQIRLLAQQFENLPLDAVRALTKSPVHEEHSLSHAILVRKFQAGNTREQERIFRFYMHNKKYVRDWDGVDDSAPYIAGPYLLDRDKAILYKLARSKRVWDRRIAIVATWWFIRQGHIATTLRLSAMLLDDREDTIHKATGWMLREVGKRDLAALKRFLRENAHQMPRTTLRYAIERFPHKERLAWLRAKSPDRRAQ